MQIDFHHAVTYVAARLAGLEDHDARVVAWSAQYVDDAIEAGTINFANGGMYCHIASAHKMLDYRNFDELANHRAWVPFHFLPGNDGLPAGEGNSLDFARRVVCRADSHVARDMVDDCLQRCTRVPYGLHLLGITMHVYADTWAHSGFSGICDNLNEVRNLRDVEDAPLTARIRHINDYFSRGARVRNKVNDFMADYPRLRRFLKEWLGIDLESAATDLINLVLPLGHGAALSLPDKPFLVWRYEDGAGAEVTRDNPALFVEAADAMCRAMQRFAGRAQTGLPAHDRRIIHDLFSTLTDDDAASRHREWLKRIHEGTFSFGPVPPVKYVETGDGSWKNAALVLGEDDWDDALFPYLPSFLSSHWKLFNDALQAHRLFVLHELLPGYGICAA